MLVMITWEDKCGLTQLWGNALNMNAMGLASQFYRQMQNLCIMVVQLFMCFYNAPEKLQKHKIHRDIDFHLLCYACFSCAPKFGAFSALVTALCSCSCSLPPLQVSGGQTVSRQQAGGFYLDPDSRWLRSVLDTSSQFPFPVGSHVRMWALGEFRGCDVSKWLLWLVFTNI